MKIQFWIGHNLHIPMLEDLYHALEKEGHECYWWAKNANIAQKVYMQGFKIQELDRYDVAFIADTGVRPSIKSGIVINLGHGLGSKGIFFTDRPAYIARENIVDYHFVPSELHKKQMMTYIPEEKLIVTGMPKLDRAFNDGYQPNINWAKAVILFAPTFNNELSAIPVVGDDIMKLENNETTVLVKLHDVTKQEWRDKYPNRILSDNIAPFLASASLIVSDVSSVLLEAMALGKRVVSVVNPKQMDYPQYKNNDKLDQCVELEYQKKAPQAKTSEEFMKLVPKILKSAPTQYPELVDYRGTSIKRCIEVLNEITRKNN